MNTTDQNRHVDRSGFPPGPWDDQPDKIQWTTKAGLPGLIVRNSIGSLCGYAAVNPGHPLHGTDYDKVPETYAIGAHGGLTYSNTCQDDGLICHTTETQHYAFIAGGVSTILANQSHQADKND